MTIISVDASKLNSNQVADYIEASDRRIAIGFRFALEILGIPLPPAAQRKPAGRPSAAALMTAVEADTGNVGAYRAEKTKFIPRAARA